MGRTMQAYSSTAAPSTAAPEPSAPAAAAYNDYADEEEEIFDEDVDFGLAKSGVVAGTTPSQARVPPPAHRRPIEDDEEDFLDDEDEEAMARQQEAAAARKQAIEALKSVPEPVKKYIANLYALVYTQPAPLAEIQQAHDQGWSRLTEKFYQKQEWPEAEVIAPLVNGDELFLALYRELYYRHVFARLQPDIDDRFHSYENYCTLFNMILNSPGPVPIELPIDWLYNIIDEFVYQYASFCLSRSQEQLRATKNGEDTDAVAGDYGAIPLYYHLGYFSILGLLRVHVLLGDYSLALGTLDNIELNKKALFTRVTAAHVAVYYYVGFSYLMMRRYPDAIRAFTHILFFVGRLKHFQRGSQFDQINKTADRMYALLAICHALCPTKLDEGISTALRERYGEQHAKMVRGGEESLPAFEELFHHGSPRFISPNPPPYESASPRALEVYVSQSDSSQHQLNIFRASVKAQLAVPTLKSFLKLYTTVGTDKLANFLSVDEDEVLEMLMAAKSASRKTTWVSGSLQEGEMVNVSDLNFGVVDSLVTVAETKASKRYAEFFLRHSLKFENLASNIENKPLPIVRTGASSGAGAASSGAGSKHQQPKAVSFAAASKA